MTRTLPALSLHVEYLDQILSGEKRWEFRNWSTAHRGDLLLVGTRRRPDHPLAGRAAALVRIDEVVPLDTDAFIEGRLATFPGLYEAAQLARQNQDNNGVAWSWAWRLDHVRRITRPFLVPGRQLIYPAPVPRRIDVEPVRRA